MRDSLILPGASGRKGRHGKLGRVEFSEESHVRQDNSARSLARRAIAAAVMVCVAATAAAQTSTAPADQVPEFRETVVVTPERGETVQAWVPAATVVVDVPTLRAVPALSLSEFLTLLPGFRVQQSALHAGSPVVSARGFFGGGEAEYVVLLVDGVPVADAESGLIDWSTVPSSAITRVEAARGPGASLYGDAAIGGVIQVLTASEVDRGALTVSGGSRGTFSADGTSRWRARSVAGLVSGAARRTDGIATHSNATEFTIGGAVNGMIRALSWRWTANALHREQEDPGALSAAQRAAGVSSDPLFRFDNRHRRGLTTALNLRGGSAGWRSQSRVSVDVRDQDDIRTILLAPALGDTRSRDLSTDGISATVDAERTLHAETSSILRVGVDLGRQHVDTAYRAVSGGAAVGEPLSRAAGTRLRSGAFVSSSWMPVSSLRVSGAVRWDRIADDAFAGAGADTTQAWSPRVGVVVHPSWFGGASLFGQVSRAFKAPTLDQLFDPRPYPDFRGSTFTISNPALRAQRASNIEGGASGGGRLRWSAVVYRMAVDDEIDFDTRTFSYGNIGQSRHVGLEADVEGTATARVRPRAAYALSRVTTADGDGGLQLRNIPRHQVTIGAAVDLGWQLQSFASVRRAWDAFFDDDNTIPVRAATLLDLRVRRTVGSGTLFLDVLNLTDRRYDEYGFVLADFRGGQVPYSYAGAPRMVRAGLTFTFR
jgi:outer membrane cobalamin receptor